MIYFWVKRGFIGWGSFRREAELAGKQGHMNSVEFPGSHQMFGTVVILARGTSGKSDVGSVRGRQKLALERPCVLVWSPQGHSGDGIYMTQHRWH